MKPEEFDQELAKLWLEVVAVCQQCACRDCIKRPCAQCDECDAPLVVCPDASLKPSAEAGRVQLEKALEEVGR